jgi:coenzyme F420-reducing hydrogenase gamma subunit
MKSIVIAVLAFGMSGCGGCQRSFTNWTGALTEKCASTGVLYVQSDSGIALLVDKDGKPVACKP